MVQGQYQRDMKAVPVYPSLLTLRGSDGHNSDRIVGLWEQEGDVI